MNLHLIYYTIHFRQDDIHNILDYLDLGGGRWNGSLYNQKLNNLQVWYGILYKNPIRCYVGRYKSESTGCHDPKLLGTIRDLWYGTWHNP